jgi:hypothetical protein
MDQKQKVRVLRKSDQFLNANNQFFKYINSCTLTERSVALTSWHIRCENKRQKINNKYASEKLEVDFSLYSRKPDVATDFLDTIPIYTLEWYLEVRFMCKYLCSSNNPTDPRQRREDALIDPPLDVNMVGSVVDAKVPYQKGPSLIESIVKHNLTIDLDEDNSNYLLNQKSGNPINAQFSGIKQQEQMFLFNYPVSYYEDHTILGLHVGRRYLKRHEPETIPHLIKDALLRYLPHKKSYNNYYTYEMKAKNDTVVANWINSSPTQIEYVAKLKKIQRFYWVDYELVGDLKNQIDAMHDQLETQRQVAGSYLTAPYSQFDKLMQFIVAIFIFFIIAVVCCSTYMWLRYMALTLLNWCLMWISNGLFVLLAFLVYKVTMYLRKSFLYDENRVPSLTLFDDFPTLSVYLEEIVKLAPFGIKFVGYLEMIKYRTWENYHMHKRLSKVKGFWNRCKVHFELNDRLWDFYSGKTKGGYLYDNYLYNILLNQPSILSRDTTTLVERYISSVYQGVPYPRCDEFRWEAVISELPSAKNPVLDKHDTNTLVEEYHAGVFPIMFAVTDLRRPCSTPNHIQKTIKTRLADVKPEEYSYEAQMFFENFIHMIIDLRPDTESKELRDMEYYEKLNPKQRARIIQDRNRYGTDRPNEICLAIKTDEMLKFTNEKFLARSLFDCSGWWSDKMGPTVDVLTVQLKTRFNYKGDGKICFSAPGKQGYRIYVPYFTCGANSRELDRFKDLADSAPPDEFWFMVMGDDTGAKNSESDFSKFDRTQDWKMIKYLIHYCQCQGYHEFAKTWKYLYKVAKKAKHKQTKTNFNVPKWVGKLTGEGPTCWSNSVFNIMSTIYAHHFVEDPVIGYKKFGFTVKYAIPKYISFLKGFFLPNMTANNTWIRAPSFIGKFGKTLKNWLHIANGDTITEKAANMLYAQWKGYGDMRNNWFYQELDDVILNLCKKCGSNMSGVEKLEFWQIETVDTGNGVTNNGFNDFIHWRYGLFEADLRDFLRCLRSIEILPCLYEHWVVTRFVDIDY